MSIDLNCDMGESFGVYHLGDDEALMTLVTSVSMACGFHAGDPVVMDRTVALAARHGVAIGAHPGYPDLAGFGRRNMTLSAPEMEAAILYQIGAASAFCDAHRIPLAHVKPHGALYNMAAGDPVIARSIARAIARFGRNLVLIGLASSEAMAEAAAAEGLGFAREAFADRVYNADGSLQSRRIAGSLITDPERCANQAVDIANGFLLAHDGTRVAVNAQTICVHGDNPKAVANATAVREALRRSQIDVCRLVPVIP
jgi:UPF0271 protein